MLLITALFAHPIQPPLRWVLKNIPLSCPQKKKGIACYAKHLNQHGNDIISRTGMKRAMARIMQNQQAPRFLNGRTHLNKTSSHSCARAKQGKSGRVPWETIHLFSSHDAQARVPASAHRLTSGVSSLLNENQ
ncbi:LOW QUALITY PROTEIN: hypothetical protein, conserved [Eimeria necatrix]|uniref:Uncharacterized protein n=1 Tax=Eimeria necatrix TaxID=51315 RepID=U6MS66_9EIME|nr:LOW QUALITY PROTEIN: hypothetical protein, conserved [Eimeria necatrix]CDJ66861.1 hypothetical protein, conserved [Eimeria necatrix]